MARGDGLLRRSRMAQQSAGSRKERRVVISCIQRTDMSMGISSESEGPSHANCMNAAAAVKRRRRINRIRRRRKVTARGTGFGMYG